VYPEAEFHEMQRQAAKVDISLASLNGDEISELIAFLHTLTGDKAKARDLYIPTGVPSAVAVNK